MMKRSVLIVGALLLVGALAWVNQGLNKAAPGEHDEETSASQSSTKPAPSTPAPTSDVVLLPEVIVGDPATAKHKILVGWVYDETNQPNPEALSLALQQISGVAEHSAGTISAVIVDLDVPDEDRSPTARAVTELGVSIDGTVPPHLSGNPGEGTVTAGEPIGLALQPVLSKK